MTSYSRLRTIAEKAQKHSGKGAWEQDRLVVIGAIDANREKTFTVAAIDMEDELPVCAGEAIAEYIEAAQPSVVLALLDEIERLRAVEAICLGCQPHAGHPDATADHFDDVSVGADEQENQ
jgi:hypothetical protein